MKCSSFLCKYKYFILRTVNPYLEYTWCQFIDGHFSPPHSMYYKVWIWIMCENNLIRWKSTAFSIQVKYNGGNLYKKLLVKKRYSSVIGRLSEQSMKFYLFFLLQIFQVRNGQSFYTSCKWIFVRVSSKSSKDAINS